MNSFRVILSVLLMMETSAFTTLSLFSSLWEDSVWVKNYFVRLKNVHSVTTEDIEHTVFDLFENDGFCTAIAKTMAVFWF